VLLLNSSDSRPLLIYSTIDIPAKITVLVTQAGAALSFFILFQYYFWENKRRNRKAHVHGVAEDEVASDTELTEEDSWGGLTDKQNWAKFRYVY
jgi:hypothetical protein